MSEKRCQLYENASCRRNLSRYSMCCLLVHNIGKDELQWNLIFHCIGLMCNLYWLTNGSCVIVLCSLNCFHFLREQGADIATTLLSMYERFFPIYYYRWSSTDRSVFIVFSYTACIRINKCIRFCKVHVKGILLYCS